MIAGIPSLSFALLSAYHHAAEPCSGECSQQTVQQTVAGRMHYPLAHVAELNRLCHRRGPKQKLGFAEVCMRPAWSCWVIITARCQ